MRKCYCDACENEITGAPRVFEVPCHTFSKRSPGGYVQIDLENDEWVPISGRMDSIDLCNKCANKAYDAALSALGLIIIDEGNDDTDSKDTA